MYRRAYATARNRKYGIVPGALAIASAAKSTRGSPILGHFESNMRAKIWKLKHRSTGRIIEVRNMMLFAEKNMDLFPGTETPLNVVRGLSQVAACNAGQAYTRARSYRGWEVVSVELPKGESS